jgi:hypothetical protein
MSIDHSSSHGPNVPAPAPDRTNTSQERNTERNTTYFPTIIKYSTPSPFPNEHLEELKANAYRVHSRICKTALEKYNRQHRTSYEWVDLVSHNIIICNGYWLHCNFKAKDKYSIHHIFFLEVKCVYHPDPNVDLNVVTACQILDGVNRVDGCHQCKTYGQVYIVAHPTRRFKTKICARAPSSERIRSLRPRPSKRSRIC